MVTTAPTEPTEAAELHYVPGMPMASGSELRLNLKALGVDGSAPDFGARLCQLSRDNEPYDFQFSAQGELIVMAPSGSDSNLGVNAINADLGIWNRNNHGAHFSQTVAFRLPSNAQYMPDAAWITQERFDNLTEFELRNTINGAPDFVVEVRSRSERLTPQLAKMAEWMEAGARLGWLLDPIDKRAYIYRPGQPVEDIENPSTLYGEDILPGFVFEVGQLIVWAVITLTPTLSLWERGHNKEATIMGRLDGKVALISGGARGQGAVEARMFASEGACVVFGDILDDEGRRVEAEIRELGGQATYVHLDVTSESDWADAVNAAVSEYGKLNVLVNNAGIVLGRSIEEMTVEEWDRLFDVNAKGVFLGTKAALPALREAGGGSIVNISSTAGLVGNDYNLAGYSSTKGAVRLFTKSTAIQHASEGIRCNSVHPGPIDTPMLRESRANRGSGLSDEEQRRRVPLGRIGRSEDIAYAVLYLASDEASFVTGSEVVVDGGRTAM